MIKITLVALAASMLLGGGVARAQAASPLSHNDYADKANWLCWPGVKDACDVDIDTTLIQANGATRVERFVADPHPPIDCFYVYPTVSNDPGVLSTMKVEAEERRVVAQQFARFGKSCRLYAPMYRQFTLTALRAAMAAGSAPAGPRPVTPYADVRDAWNYYLAHENYGRGVVLIGHSQGSGVLTQLIKMDIDGKPSQARLVSAILMGTSLVVPKGADVGGDFKSVPLCHAASQTGCAIAYASFRDTSPPPENSRFGRPRTPAPDGAAACVNPASLSGGPGALHSYFATDGDLVTERSEHPSPWLEGKTIATPFVSVPGLLTAACVSTPEFNYLAIHVNSDQPGPRAHDIPGDVVVMGHILKDWGLHLIDANLAMGNLVDIVHAEGAAWVAGHP
jgi:hypothetical protein